MASNIAEEANGSSGGESPKRGKVEPTFKS